MISVVIATLNSERKLLPTLSALVPGAIDGLITEVIVADGGSGDETAVVADAAGCRFVSLEGPAGRRLRMAAETARAPWLLFLRPAILLEAGWPAETRRFVERPEKGPRTAAFRSGAATPGIFRAAGALFAAAVGTPPHPEQGLLIAREFYVALGGHSEGVADSETDLLRRIGRRRIVVLAPAAIRVDT